MTANRDDTMAPETIPETTLETTPETASPEALGKQARWGITAVLVIALAVIFSPKGDGSFDAPGGFVLDGDGRPRPLASRLAPVSLVHFWATWCPPCITEIPALDRLAEDYDDRGEFDLVMIAVDDTLETVRPFVGDRASMMLYDPDWDVANRYGTKKLPETYLVVRGKVVEKWIGAQNWDDPKIRRQLDEHLAAATST